MESNMVKDSPEVAMVFIDELFKIMLPQFEKKYSCNMGLYCYGQTYEYNKIKISLGCERGFFNCDLTIQNKNVILDLPEEKKYSNPTKIIFDLFSIY